MDIQKELKKFKKEFDLELEKYLDKTIKEARKKDRFVANALEYSKKLALSGGKRLRPALMYYGYLGTGGNEKEEILKTSVSIELIHIFLLIHDDVVDRDAKRHGIKTIHSHYQKLGKKLFPQKDAKHFGNSVAIILGDILAALGNQIIFQSKFKQEVIIKVLSKLQSVVSLTAIGEVQDIYIEYRGKASEEEIIKMYTNKTAKYSIEGPLQLGAILGEADGETLKSLSSLSIPLGIAFQIQDDILGIFGNEEKLGKPVGSDIQEGKQTILAVKAFEKANSYQKEILKNILGKKDLSYADIENFRETIIDTGALSYAKDLAQKNIAEAKKEIRASKLKGKAKEFLLAIADYMAEREM